MSREKSKIMQLYYFTVTVTTKATRPPFIDHVLKGKPLNILFTPNHNFVGYILLVPHVQNHIASNYRLRVQIYVCLNINPVHKKEKKKLVFHILY